LGDPYFKKKRFLKQQGVHVYSSNYALYGDLSNRVMTILQQEEPEVEVYSIDESFIRLPPQQERSMTDRGLELKRRIGQCVGIPVSVGIASTKTRAKIATSVAKKYQGYGGVFDLESCREPDAVLAGIKVGKVWGIGCRSVEKLERKGIYTALDLKNSDERMVRKLLSLPGMRTVMELRGQSCIDLEDCPPARKSIVSSRSFRKPVTELQDLKEAVSSYITIAARKLRDQELVAANLHVFLSTSRFRTDIPRFSESRMITLAQPTSSTPLLIRAGMRELTDLYRPGYPFNKAGIMLTGLSSRTRQQLNLFALPEESGSESIMKALDQVNDRWGRDMLRYASSGLIREWSMKQTRKSPAYTTSWGELPVANALKLRMGTE
jgi:DNA polymerase V